MTAVRRADDRALLGAALLGAATLAASALTVGDVWYALASGQWILAARALPALDPFTYTGGEQPHVTSGWAAHALFALVWAQGGRLALLGLKALVAVATFAVVLRTMAARGVRPLPAAAVTLVAAWATSEFWQVRSQVFTYLALAVLAWLLRDGWERRPGTLVLVPALMVVWVNLDAGFVAGGLLVALAGAGAALPRLVAPARRAEGVRVLGRAAVLAGLTALAALANPFGVGAVGAALGSGPILPFLAGSLEWSAPNFHHPNVRGFELLLLALFPAFARGRGRLHATDVAWLLVLAHLGLTTFRHIPLFAIVAAAPLADALQAALRELGRGLAPRALEAVRRRLPSIGPALASPRAPVLGGALLVLLGVGTYWLATVRLGLDPVRRDLAESRYPAGAVSFIREHRLPGRLFSVNVWSGYELWRLHPEYQAFLAGPVRHAAPDVAREFGQVWGAGPGWEGVLERWQVQTVLAQRGSHLDQALSADRSWRRVFAQADAAVFVRDTEANRPLLVRLERLSRDGAAAGRAPVPAAERAAGFRESLALARGAGAR
jgi:hypothetical protein